MGATANRDKADAYAAKLAPIIGEAETLPITRQTAGNYSAGNTDATRRACMWSRAAAPICMAG